jgi:predicted histidine transporter YuiF (NhaC family)
MKKFEIDKSKILLSLPLVLISVKIYLGAVFGYFFARILAERIDSIIFTVGSLQIHFHHWLMGFIGLVIALLVTLSPLIDHLIYGFLSGLIFEGIFNYPDWYKILTRKKE